MKEVDSDRLTRRGAYSMKFHNNLLIQVRASHLAPADGLSPPSPGSFQLTRMDLRLFFRTSLIVVVKKKAKAQVKKSNWAVGFAAKI